MPRALSDQCAIRTRWEQLKDDIWRLYVKEKHSLERVRGILEKDYNFNATNSQLERQVKKWGFRKHLKKEDWIALNHQMLKRKRLGKESDVYIDGIPQSQKKLRKEISRNCPGTGGEPSANGSFPQGQFARIRSPWTVSSPRIPSGVVICTPGSSELDFTEPRNLPCFHFERFLHENIQPFQGSTWVGNPLYQTMFSSTHTGSLISNPLFLDMVREGTFRTNSRDNTRISVGEESSFISNLLPLKYAPSLLAHEGDPALQLLKLTAFLLSNKILELGRKLVRKIVVSFHNRWLRPALERLLSAEGPTSEALAESLFWITIEEGYEELLPILLQVGLNPNDRNPNGVCPFSCTALNFVTLQGNIGMVKHLLAYGAKIDGACASQTCTTPLQNAISQRHIQLACCLIKEKANVNLVGGSEIDRFSLPHDPADNWVLPTALLSLDLPLSTAPLSLAAQVKSSKLVDLLVKYGADVNQKTKPELTALWCAVTPVSVDKYNPKSLILSNDVENGEDTTPSEYEEPWVGFNPVKEVSTIVQSLLDAGARIDSRLESRGRHSGASTVFDKAACWGSAGLVRLLFHAGVSITTDTLYFAAKSNSIPSVQTLLDLRAPVGDALEAAVENQNIELVKLLLGAGATIRSSGVIRETDPLQTACRLRNFELVPMLLEAAAAAGDPWDEWDDDEKISVVEAAIETANIRLVKTLLKTGPSFDGVLDRPLLFAAVKSRKLPLVQLILDAGFHVNAAFDVRAIVLREAVRLGDHHIVKLLLDAGFEVNAEYEIGAPAIREAVWLGDHHIVQMLLDAGAYVNFVSKNSDPDLLTRAISKRDTKMIDQLLRAGADVNHPSYERSTETALQASISICDVQLIHRLLDIGANAEDPFALLAAVSRPLRDERIELVRILLDARSKSRYRGDRSYGCFALQKAIRQRDLKLVEILLDAGIDVNTHTRRYPDSEPDGFHNQLRRAESETIDSEITVMTRNDVTIWGFCGETALATAIRTCKDQDHSFVRKLLKRGAKPDDFLTHSPKRTALVLAIETNVQVPVIELLLEAGAEVNTPATKGIFWTALQAAAAGGNMEIVETLLRAGAHVNAKPSFKCGLTALQAAARGGFINVACLLIHNDAEVNAMPSKRGGRTALEVAAEKGRIDMVQLLLEAGADIWGTGEAQYERALEFARLNGHNAVRKVLQSHHDRQFVSSDFELQAPYGVVTGASISDASAPTGHVIETEGIESLLLAPTTDFQIPEPSNVESGGAENSGVAETAENGARREPNLDIYDFERPWDLSLDHQLPGMHDFDFSDLLQPDIFEPDMLCPTVAAPFPAPNSSHAVRPSSDNLDPDEFDNDGIGLFV